MKRILAIIMLAITAQAADIVVYPTAATGSEYPAMVQKSGQTTSYLSGDDGYIRAGITRPNPLYTIMTDTNCVRDNMTGLIWARNANVISNTAWDVDGKVKTWADGLLAISNLNATTYGGRTDWRMPNVKEMESLLNYEFTSVPWVSDATGTNQWTAARGPWINIRTRYMTSDTYRATPTFYIFRDMGGTAGTVAKTTSTHFVWPCAGP